MTDGPDARTTRLAEIADLVAAHHGASQLLPGVELARVTTTGPPRSSIADPVLALVARGAKEIARGDQVLSYGAGDYLVVSLDLPVSGRFTRASPAEPFLGVGLALDPTLVAELVMDSGPLGEAPRTPTDTAALGVAAAPVELLDAVARLLRLLDSPADVNVLAPLLHREILWRLLNGPQGHLVRAIGTPSSALAHVARTVRWIREHHADPFRIEDLADRAAMSTSTLHRHFRAATSLSPLQFQKKVRLHQARLLLGGSAHDVTRVAHEVGYDSPSQFSREYRREFGTSPSDEIRRSLTGR